MTSSAVASEDMSTRNNKMTPYWDDRLQYSSVVGVTSRSKTEVGDQLSVLSALPSKYAALRGTMYTRRQSFKVLLLQLATQGEGRWDETSVFGGSSRRKPKILIILQTGRFAILPCFHLVSIPV